ncbi:MAG: hypothetical protein IJV27_06290 [Prevotella sp.]|nr:hypothetical protein [Prevotella sp.]
MRQKETGRLLDRYLAGETSNAEEQLLRDYFAHADSDVTAEWKPFKALFAFVESERSRHTEQRVLTAERRRNGLRQTVMWACSVAASAVLLFSLAVKRGSDAADYAVIDGRRTTDSEVIKQEAEAALNLVSTTEQADFGALNEI